MLDNETLGISPYIPIGLRAASSTAAALSALPLVTSPGRYIAAQSCLGSASLSVQAKAINLSPLFVRAGTLGAPSHTGSQRWVAEMNFCLVKL